MKGLPRIWKSEAWLAVILVGLVSIITFFPYLSQLGVYRDDWYVLWSGTTRGAASLIDLFSIDRPFMGVVYSLTYALFHNNPLAWNLFSFFTRLVGVYALLWLLRRVWPGQSLATTLMALLFIVYPGFLQQPNANTFSNHFITYTLAILSIAFTMGAVQASRTAAKIGLTLVALVLAVGYFLIYEYMIGLEGLRLLLIGYLTFRQTADRFVRRAVLVLKRWIPYAAVIIAYLVWRIFLYQSDRPTTDMSGLLGRYAGSPFMMAVRLVMETGKDFFETAFVAWFHPVYTLTASAEYKELVGSILLAAIAGGLILVYARFVRGRNAVSDPDQADAERRLYIDWIVLGALTILATLIPMVVAGRDVHYHSAFDRYTLQATIGVAMLLVGGVFLLARRKLRIVPILALVGLGVVTHFHNANDFAIFWQYQRQLWWQLTWRAPQITPGTVVVAQLPYAFLEGYEIWAPANLIYFPEDDGVRIAAEILNEDTARKIVHADVEKGLVRKVTFDRDFGKTLVLAYPSFGSCLHVLDTGYLEIPLRSNSLLRSVAPYSHIDRVVTDTTPPVPGAEIFGSEPERGWCYYYQQAELARQKGDWAEVARLGDEAFRQGFKPDERSEYLPFIEAFIRAGRLAEAHELTTRVQDLIVVRDSLCDMLEKNSTGSEADARQIDPDLIQMLCENNEVVTD